MRNVSRGERPLDYTAGADAWHSNKHSSSPKVMRNDGNLVDGVPACHLLDLVVVAVDLAPPSSRPWHFSSLDLYGDC